VLNKSATNPSKSRALVEDLGMLVAKTRRMVWTNATRTLEETGDSMLSWQLLSLLVRGGKQTQTEVSVALAQHPAGVSRLLDDLEKQGYVARRRDPEDRRRVYVEATPRGQRRFRVALPTVLRGVEKAFEPLSQAERRALRGLLLKVVSQEPEHLAAIHNGGGRR
jgi:DNA-binding MarR family transcriptional regulator